jgi:hypothetical protein
VLQFSWASSRSSAERLSRAGDRSTLGAAWAEAIARLAKVCRCPALRRTFVWSRLVDIRPVTLAAPEPHPSSHHGAA